MAPPYTEQTFLRFSPDEKWLLVGAHYGDAHVWNLTTDPPEAHKVRVRRQGELIGSSVHFIDNRTLVAVGEKSKQGTALIYWDTVDDARITQRSMAPIRRHSGEFRISSDRSRLVIALPKRGKTYNDYTTDVIVWDIAKRKAICQRTIDQKARQIQLSADGSVMAVSVEGPDRVVVYSLDDGNELYQCALSLFGEFLMFPDGKRLIVEASQGLIQVAIPTGQEEPIELDDWFQEGGVAISADGQRLLTGHFFSGNWRVWDITNQKEISRIKNSQQMAEISPTGRMVALYHRPNVTVWQVDLNKMTQLPDVTSPWLPNVCGIACLSTLFALAWSLIGLVRYTHFSFGN